jgi:leucyl-tRNA synthetase family protein
MKQYDPSKIEKKWQKVWEEKGMYQAEDNSLKPKYFPLVEFPFPSGAGLHTGHIRSYTAMDIIARKRRAEGFNVLYPIGWDAFGLPTENYAIKTGEQPAVVTKQNTDTFRRQLKALGLSFDWSREVNTSDPAYYKWTQWIFLQMYKKGLAYKAKMTINWCPKDKIGLANEEVVDGTCERCGTEVEKKEKEQWMLAITKYADRLHNDLDEVDFLEKIKIQQRNWIGRSEGAELSFKIKDSQESISVFTTRADTLFGVTYIVLAPEHELVQKYKEQTSNISEIESYIKDVRNRTDIERVAEGKEKSGVELKGVKALHPITGEELPVWIADYVLSSYGTGAVMAVPAHDERDFEFAQKYNLAIKEVVRPSVVDHINPPRADKQTKTRNNVHALVYDTVNKKYLILKNDKFGWNTVIIGGIEDGEDVIQAALRELKEETGYVDLELKRVLGNPVQASYFAKHKDENRVAIATAVYFELKSDKQVEISTEGDNEGNEVKWVDAKEFVPGIMVNSELSQWLERLHSGKDTAYLGDGIH